MFIPGGIVFSQQTVHDWEGRLTPALAEDPKRHRSKTAHGWYVDDPPKVDGRWWKCCSPGSRT
jgi:transposase-like protein